MKRNIVKLQFLSPLHIGSDQPGIGQESVEMYIHSDTLFSCIVNAYNELNGFEKTEDFINEILDNPEIFKISSAFPYIDNPQYGARYYFPKPLLDPADFFMDKMNMDTLHSYRKVMKSTPFVESSIYLEWLGGANDVCVQLFKQQNLSEYFKVELTPRNAMDRLSEQSNIYHSGMLYIQESAGLYFLIEYDEGVLSQKEFKNTLMHAGEMGIGGMRTYGLGRFKPELLEVDDIETIQELFTNYSQKQTTGEFLYTTVSVVAPDRQAMNYVNDYQLLRRNGWTYSTAVLAQLPRKSSCLFSEGSVFTKPPRGSIQDVTPSEFPLHKVFRYGVGLYFNIKSPRGEAGE